ncbi:MAG TPA: SDR family oxidoreductase [Candidatus Acidoferrales bacterium]|nr:SDR family oxidoreductase [Candidatus Acidoferrales bacterium]
MLLEGQVAIVTGGGRGIGRAIARKFASEGAAVVVTARTETEIKQVAAEIQQAAGKAAAVAANVGREADCEKIVAAARNAFGTVHILVNNAAIYGPVQPVEKWSAPDWDEVMAVNLRGPMLLSKLVLPEMYARGSGSILNISTVGAKAAFALSAAYTASKAGLIGLTRVLAAESGRRGVRVNAICPGPVTETRMSQDLTREFSAYFKSGTDDALKQMLEGILQGRPQTADEIAAAALFLVSDQARAITGQTLNVDGGMVFY